MDFKTFLIKKVMLSFFVSVTFIALAMAIIGTLFQPYVRFGYEVLFYPLLFAAIAAVLSLIQYSKRELSVKETLLRDGIYLISLEIVILTLLIVGGAIHDSSLAISLFISILFIYSNVKIILWINDSRIAKAINNNLKSFKEHH